MTQRFVHTNGVHQVLYWAGPGYYSKHYEVGVPLPGLGEVGLYEVRRIDGPEDDEALEVYYAETPDDIGH